MHVLLCKGGVDEVGNEQKNDYIVMKVIPKLFLVTHPYGYPTMITFLVQCKWYKRLIRIVKLGSETTNSMTARSGTDIPKSPVQKSLSR